MFSIYTIINECLFLIFLYIAKTTNLYYFDVTVFFFIIYIAKQLDFIAMNPRNKSTIEVTF